MKKVLFILSFGSQSAVPAAAELTVDDTASDAYLRNHGYSQSTINVVNKAKAQVNGEPMTEPVEKEYYNQPLVKWFRKFVMYVDPALDDHSFMNHEIHTAPSYEDL